MLIIVVDMELVQVFICHFVASLAFQFPAGAPTLLRIFLLFKGVKSLYFTYSIMNFTVLNLQGITSLHLLTTRVGLLILLVTSFLTLQSRKVTVLLLLDRKLYCLKLTRDY